MRTPKYRVRGVEKRVNIKFSGSTDGNDFTDNFREYT